MHEAENPVLPGIMAAKKIGCLAHFHMRSSARAVSGLLGVVGCAHMKGGLRALSYEPGGSTSSRNFKLDIKKSLVSADVSV